MRSASLWSALARRSCLFDENIPYRVGWLININTRPILRSKFTTWEDEAAKFKAHQRIIQYNFVNIHMVVRSASDTSIQNQELDSEYGNASTNTTRLTSTVLLKALAGCRYIKAASQLLKTKYSRSMCNFMYNDFGYIRRLHSGEMIAFHNYKLVVVEPNIHQARL